MTCQIGYCAIAGARDWGRGCAGKVRLPWASLRYHQSKVDLATGLPTEVSYRRGGCPGSRQAEVRPCAFPKWPSSTSFWAFWRQIGLNHQLGSWLMERWDVKGPRGHFHHDGFSFFFVFVFSSRSVSPAAVCHCVLVTLTLYHSPTHAHNTLTISAVE